MQRRLIAPTAVILLVFLLGGVVEGDAQVPLSTGSFEDDYIMDSIPMKLMDDERRGLDVMDRSVHHLGVPAEPFRMITPQNQAAKGLVEPLEVIPISSPRSFPVISSHG